MDSLLVRDKIQLAEGIISLVSSGAYEVERMDVELKAFEGLDSGNEYVSNIAKAVMAMANYGGGIIIVGYRRNENGARATKGIWPLGRSLPIGS